VNTKEGGYEPKDPNTSKQARMASRPGDSVYKGRDGKPVYLNSFIQDRRSPTAKAQMDAIKEEGVGLFRGLG
jgi:hypothetical protein